MSASLMPSKGQALRPPKTANPDSAAAEEGFVSDLGLARWRHDESGHSPRKPSVVGTADYMAQAFSRRVGIGALAVLASLVLVMVWLAATREALSLRSTDRLKATEAGPDGKPRVIIIRE